MTRAHRFPVAVAVVAVAALALPGCSGKQGDAGSPAAPTVTTPPVESASPTAEPRAEQTPTDAASSSDAPGPVATMPAVAPKRQGDTKAYKFGDIEILLTPNELGVYTAIHIPNPSRRSIYFSITVRVTGPRGYAVTMKREFPSVQPGDSAREAGLLIDEDGAPVPTDPVAQIVAFEQS
ncbi:hypothetical protein GCM10018966_020080 [Streptomyces yanii]